MTEQEIRDFFGRYRDAFNELDGDAVADLWHTPSSITDSEADSNGKPVARVTLWSDDAPKRKNMRALCDVYMLNDFHAPNSRSTYSTRSARTTPLPTCTGNSGARTAACSRSSTPRTSCCAPRKGRRCCSRPRMKKTSRE